MSGRPPWPGPRPVIPTYPFAEAQAASDAITVMIDELEDVRRALVEGMHDLEAGPFEGVFADYFRDDNQHVIDMLDERVTQLEGHVDDISQWRMDAQNNLEAARHARERWYARRRDWNLWHATHGLQAPQ